MSFTEAEEFADDEGDTDAETDVTQSVLSEDESVDRNNRRERDSRISRSFVHSDLEEGNEEEEDATMRPEDRESESERTSHKRTPSEEIDLLGADKAAYRA